jgi:RNA polymerase sigma-70 factor (ECF subfamily)
MPKSTHGQEGNDEELMERFKEGDESAFVVLYHRYNRRVYAYCIKMVKSRERAEDLYQEIFIRVARKRENFRSGNFAAWLFAIARNLCLNALRDNVEHVQIEDVQDSLAAPVETSEYEMSSDILRRAIDQLPPDLRETLVLRVYNGFSYNEISEITETKLSTVKVRIFRAKQRLHEMLAPYFVDRV